MGLFDLLRPKPIDRTPEERSRLVEEAAGLSLYCSPWCGYCRIVERSIRLLGLEIEVRDVASEPGAHRDLVEGGGRGQVPCLRIEEDGTVQWLYESREIVSYLHRRFAPVEPAPEKP